MGVKASPRIIIDDVKFDGPIHISDSDRQQLVSELKERSYRADYDWLSEVQEIGIKSVWRDRGYFKVEVSAKEELLRSDSAGEHVLVIVHVDEGAQYRLGSIQFRSSDPDVPLAFPTEDLRKLIPMNTGDIFSAEKIRESLDSLKLLYGSNGYIDFVAEPLTDIDDSPDHRISLVMELDQQKQYRLGKIEVLGPNPVVETFLKSKLRPGDVYNWKAVENLVKENEAVLPPNTSPQDLELNRNVKNGTVDLRFNFSAPFNFQTCSQFQN